VDLGGYHLGEMLGEGGGGRVFRASHAKLGRLAAIKVLSSAKIDDAGAVLRFLHEAKIVAALGHPNIVQVFDFLETEVPRRVAYVMELLEGPPLARVLEERRLSFAQALNISLQLLDALEAVHQAGIVHRDLKPGNIMVVGSLDTDLSERPSVKILDFGIAKVSRQVVPQRTRSGTMIGTPAYMAPEQVAMEEVTPASDVYAFGEILFEMIAHRRAFPSEDVADVLYAKLDQRPPALEIEGSEPAVERVLQLVRTCLANRPQDRPAIGALKNDLGALLRPHAEGIRRREVRFQGGADDALDAEIIERELATALSETRAASCAPVTRACLWNVVVHIDERSAADKLDLAQLIRDLPRYLGARALVLRLRDEREEGAELESWISANCVVAEGGGKLICSEEVNIAARGKGERHLPGLVNALLVPDVPTALVFAGAPSLDRPAIDQVLRSADRVVTHADRSTARQPLDRLRALLARVPLGPIDLGWLESSELRAGVAAIFDTREGEAAGIERATITSDPSHRWSAHLLAGWIAAALGGSRGKQVGERAWSFSRPTAAPLEIVLSTGVSLAIELEAPSTGSKHLASVDPGARRSYAALLARALATRSQDRAFARALEIAATVTSIE
jgi:glucose-6-phosphate dehydrogenase assembly protein OpcA